jgi:hypothetical protein
MPIRTVLIAGWMLVSLASALAADDIYVNNVSGDDQFNGLPAAAGSALSGPVRTITRALELAGPGDRIVVERTDVPYRESLSIQGGRHSGTTIQPFRIVSNGAILDGTGPIPGDGWEHVEGQVFRYQPDLKSHQQLYLNGRPLERVAAPVPGYLPELRPLQWALVDGWIYFCTEDETAPTQYELFCSVCQTGVTLYQVEQLILSGFVIQGFQLDGVNAHDGVKGAVITGCQLRGNGRSGLSAGGASEIKIDQSIVGSNAIAQVRTEGLARVWVENCRLLESASTGPGFLRTSGQIMVDGEALR